MNNNELKIPDQALSDKKSIELLRVWVANKRQHISMRSGLWKDPAAWGIMICDLMTLVAKSYQDEGGLKQDAAFRRILDGLHAELSTRKHQMPNT